MSGRGPGNPAYLWLWYADGGPLPAFSQYCSELTPPAPYRCAFAARPGQPATTDPTECKRQVQAYLDTWYADFNVVFTADRPPVGADYYLMVIASGWPQCAAEAATLTGGSASYEAGIAPWNFSCADNVNQAAIAIQCGYDAHDCATIIAHEHGHLVGLLHTKSNTDVVSDVMNETVQSTAVGFDRQDDAVVLDLQGYYDACPNTKTQNSHQAMLAVLGPWPGGPKPSLFPSSPDAGVADARPDRAVDASHSGSVGPTTGSTVDAGKLVVVPGYDALTRPSLPDAPTMDSASSKGGCSLDSRHAPPGATPALVALLGLLAARFTRGRRGRLGLHAGGPPPCAEPARSPSACRAPAP